MGTKMNRDVVLSRRGACALAATSLVTLASCARQAASVADEETPQDAVVEEPTSAVPTVREQGAYQSCPVGFGAALLLGRIHSIRLIGDSITAGWGCDGYGAETDTLIYEGSYGSFYETDASVACWANDFRSFAAEHGVTDFVNAGISGAKMRWLAEEPEAWIREGADAIFVMLGTNDAVYSSEDEFAADAERALSAVHEACAHMVVVAPPVNDRHDATNLCGPEVLERVLRELCRGQGWEFVSLLNAIELGTDLINEDQCHPTSKGSHAMWEHMKGALGLA